MASKGNLAAKGYQPPKVVPINSSNTTEGRTAASLAAAEARQNARAAADQARSDATLAAANRAPDKTAQSTQRAMNGLQRNEKALESRGGF